MKPTVAELDQVGARIRDLLADVGLEAIENVDADVPLGIVTEAVNAQEAGRVWVILAAEVTHGTVTAAVIARKQA